MRVLMILTAGGLLVAGCATHQTDRSVSRLGGLDDQPQTSAAGEGSLMPGAYESRTMETGQFTGRERTNDQIGQRPTLPREADARERERE